MRTSLRIANEFLSLNCRETQQYLACVAPGPGEPTQEHIAGGSHQPLAHHHALAGMRKGTGPRIGFQHQSAGLLDLQEERIAVHVAGSWIFAIGLLLLGWSLRAA